SLSHSGTVPGISGEEFLAIPRCLEKGDSIHLQEFADTSEAALHIRVYFFLRKTYKCSRKIRKQTFKLQTPYERFFEFFPFGDVSSDPTSAHDLALTISYRGNGHGNIYGFSLFCDTHRFTMFDVFAIAQSPLDVSRFIVKIGRRNYCDRLSYCF